MTIVATNDQRIREFLKPRKSFGPSVVCTAAEGTTAPVERAARAAWFSTGMCDAWQNSCNDAEADWNKAVDAIIGLEDSNE